MWIHPFSKKILEQNYPIEEIGNILLLPLNEESIFKYFSYQCLQKSYSCLLYLLSCEHLEIKKILNTQIFNSIKSLKKTKDFNDNNFYIKSFLKFLRIVKKHIEKKSTKFKWNNIINEIMKAKYKFIYYYIIKTNTNYEDYASEIKLFDISMKTLIESSNPENKEVALLVILI